MSRGGFSVVGQQDGWLIVAEILDEELAESASQQADLLFMDLRRAVFAIGDIEVHGAPGGRRQVADLGEEFARASAQGHEDDALLVEPIELRIVGEPRVEDKMLGQAAMPTFPELDEAEDLLGLLTLADISVRVAKDLAVGVLGQEGENTRLAAASLG